MRASMLRLKKKERAEALSLADVGSVEGLASTFGGLSLELHAQAGELVKETYSKYGAMISLS
jgi:hypothetical protein